MKPFKKKVDAQKGAGYNDNTLNETVQLDLKTADRISKVSESPDDYLNGLRHKWFLR